MLDHGVKLPEDGPTVGEILRADGYRTALLGKAHFQPLASAEGSESLEAQPTLRDLDFGRGFQGPWYGFEHVEVLRNQADESHVGQHYAIWMEENGLPDWRDYFEGWPEDPSVPPREHSWTLPEEFHYSRWLGLRTCDYLTGRQPSQLSRAGGSQPHVPGGLPYRHTRVDAGGSQLDCWRGSTGKARDHVIVENRHQPTAVHVRTYIDDRYKITIWRGRPFGELFDLERDPGENQNLWDDPASQDLKVTLMHRFVQADMEREPTRMPRIAGLRRHEGGRDGPVIAP